MTCAKCGKKNLERDATGAYRCCGVETRLVDPGMPPRGRVVDPLKPLPEEKGWSQAEQEALSESVPKRPHPSRLPEDHPDRLAWREKVAKAALEGQRERREWEKANGLTVASEATRKAWETRRAKDHAAAVRENTRRINKATAKRGEMSRRARARRAA